jgi:branched-chain amino acid transport system permease protein
VESYYAAWGLVVAALFLAVNLIHSRVGRALRSIHGGEEAAGALGVDTARYKLATFIAGAVLAGVAGAFLIVIQPVQPAIGREYIGLVFAVCVLGGMGSIWGTLIGALVLGTAESFTSTFFGPSWAPAVSFGLLLGTLAFRPSGILGR